MLLRYQNQLPRRLSSFQVPVCLLRLVQVVDVLDAQLELAGGDHVEDVAGAPLIFFTGSSVMKQGWARKEQRPFLGKFDGIKRRHCATGAAKQHYISSRTHNVQIFIKRAFANSVIDYVYAF